MRKPTANTAKAFNILIKESSDGKKTLPMIFARWPKIMWSYHNRVLQTKLENITFFIKFLLVLQKYVLFFQVIQVFNEAIDRITTTYGNKKLKFYCKIIILDL